jgi:hypothetical protein
MDGDIKHKYEVLRAQDIIPSTESKSGQGNSLAAGDTKIVENGVPRFDLATEIMAQQRKLTSSRRKRPENKVPPARDEFPAKASAVSTKAFALPTSAHASVIAEIVRRDIQRMLLTHSGSQA